MKTPLAWLVLALALLHAATGGAAPPNVVTIRPARQRIDAPANTIVQVRFDQDIDSSTVNGASMRVFGRWSGPATGTIEVDDSTITSHVKRIRRKFLAVDPAFDAIDTVYGMGYRWQA